MEATETLGGSEVEIEFDADEVVVAVVDEEGTGNGLFEYARGVLLGAAVDGDNNEDDDASWWRVNDSRLPRTGPD